MRDRLGRDRTKNKEKDNFALLINLMRMMRMMEMSMIMGIEHGNDTINKEEGFMKYCEPRLKGRSMSLSLSLSTTAFVDRYIHCVWRCVLTSQSMYIHI